MARHVAESELCSICRAGSPRGGGAGVSHPHLLRTGKWNSRDLIGSFSPLSTYTVLYADPRAPCTSGKRPTHLAAPPAWQQQFLADFLALSQPEGNFLQLLVSRSPGEAYFIRSLFCHGRDTPWNYLIRLLWIFVHKLFLFMNLESYAPCW